MMITKHPTHPYDDEQESIDPPDPNNVAVLSAMTSSQPAWKNPFKRLTRPFDWRSLQVRLTLGVAMVSVIGVGSVAFWTAWKTQQILIASHKQFTQDVGERFPNDVQLYSDMMPVDEALQKAIDNRTLPGLLIAVVSPQQTLLAASDAVGSDMDLPNAITQFSGMGLEPKVYDWNGRYFVMCQGPLTVNGSTLGTMFVAQEITADQLRFLSVVRGLAIATGLAIVAVTVTIALYVRRSLRPLRRVSQLTDRIEAQDLGHIKLQLEQAPTEVTELVNTCERMLARLSDSWEQQRQFVNDISHELRTPLTVVSGYLQSTLRRNCGLSEPQKEALEIAASEADRTIQLLQDMLDLARADSGGFRFSLEPLMLNDIVLDVVSMAETSSDRRIELEAESANIPVWVDRNRLKQVLVNLIDNAIKYSAPMQPITVKLSQQNGYATIQVCDRGCGIPLQQQARIFDRFYRVDEARARSTGGCGLGLSIVKTLTEGMGGCVTVSSYPKQGSTFTVTLPQPGGTHD